MRFGALMIVLAVVPSSDEITRYVGKHFEVRDHDAPVKYIFNGQTRVTGSLSATERIQRLRLRAGWNLVSRDVNVPNILKQLEELVNDTTPPVQAFYCWQPTTRDYLGVGGEHFYESH